MKMNMPVMRICADLRSIPPVSNAMKTLNLNKPPPPRFRIRANTILWMLMAVLCGCATGRHPFRFQPSQLSLLHLNMSKASVLELLGSPGQCATQAEWDMAPTGARLIHHEIFQYAHVLPRASATNFYLVMFREGKVAEYGPQIGRLKNRVIDVFIEPEPESSSSNALQSER
jgi:hypothetical protein